MMENERFPIYMRTELLTIPNMEIWSNPELNCLWCGCLTYWNKKKRLKTSCNISKPCMQDFKILLIMNDDAV